MSWGERLANLVKDIPLRPYINMKIITFLLPIKPTGPDGVITVIAFCDDFQVCLGKFFCKFIKGVASAFESPFFIRTFEDVDIAFIDIYIQKRDARPVCAFRIVLILKNCREEKRNTVVRNFDFMNACIV